MSQLLERIGQDLTVAMKDRDQVVLSTLRMVRAQAQKLKADRGAQSVLSDEDVLTILRQQIKSRKEAAAQYEKGGAHDRAQGELAEVAVLERYLPAQLSDQELETMIRASLSLLTNPSPRDMGKVMGDLMPKVAGRADGNRVRELVAKLLAQ